MSSHPRKPGFIALTLLILAALACSMPQTTSSPPVSQPSTQPTSQPSPLPQASESPKDPVATKAPSTPFARAADHLIGTHRIYGIAEFFRHNTSDPFVPRGVNYSILVPIFDHYEDRLFGTGEYDHDRTQADFAALSAAGYNTLRISVDGCTSGEGCIGLANGQGLNPTYLDNMVDLMKLARDANLFLIMASSDLPEQGGYAASASQDADRQISSGRNAQYLTSSGIHAARQYWTDLLTGLLARQAPLEIVLGWELQSEQYYQGDQAPFNLESGKLRTVNGSIYDLAVSAQKQDLAVDGVRYYISQVRQAINTYDPTALVSMGFFAPNQPNEWREDDDRLVVSAGLLEESDLDFFDFQAYPGGELSLQQLTENYGLTGHVNRPILMGEVGASTWIYPQVSKGAIAVQDWIAESCKYGFSGWMYEEYYSQPAGLPEATWGFVDEHNLIMNALAPKNQPDACATTVLPGRNLAQGKPVSVSGALPDQTPEMAVDGDPNTQWSSGGFPTQWIEIDLGAPFSIGEIRLTVGQWPEGDVLHQVWVGASPDSMQQLHEIKGEEYDYDVLSYVPDKPLKGIRYVRIVTTESPSWVSWREIEVFAPFPSTPTPTPEASPTATP